VSTRYAFFYLMRTSARGIAEAVPDHVAHWRGLGLGDYLGGPFQDRTGGLITFRAEAVHRAEEPVARSVRRSRPSGCLLAEALDA